ncbi:hypothetical protein CYMTET_4610 [Cymbomonas tetramitiformis]|uniref:Uncharacterized protein n=1 Tax=Cymbomonas tetramitiformis TaxID=36881 RepID=A0AAE0LJW3_9CHLO|nr:hypothetical protein CYMTET_4610 [Cymbomonas tetramitiformis]
MSTPLDKMRAPRDATGQDIPWWVLDLERSSVVKIVCSTTASRKQLLKLEDQRLEDNSKCPFRSTVHDPLVKEVVTLGLAAATAGWYLSTELEALPQQGTEEEIRRFPCERMRIAYRTRLRAL